MAAVPFVTNTVPTTLLFSITFNVVGLVQDIPDVSWTQRGDGFVPPEVVLDNPEGAGIDISAVPEPSAALLVSLGLAVLGARPRSCAAL